MLLVANVWIFVLISCAGAVFVIFVITKRLLIKKRIRNYLTTHSISPDKDFLAGLKVTSKQYDMCLAIRRVAAKTLEVPSETLYPSDSMDYLEKLGFDIHSFILELESVLSLDIDHEAFAEFVCDKGFVNPATFADFVHLFLDHPEFIAATNNLAKPTLRDD